MALSARARSGCSLTILCRPGAVVLLSDAVGMAAVVLDVIERATAVRSPPRRGDSLYSGEERTRGEPR